MSVDYYDEDCLELYDSDKCLGDLGEKWCIFKWRINNLQLSPLEIVQSPVFTTRLLPKTHWCLEVKLLSPGDLRSLKMTLRRLQTVENNVSIVDVIYKVDIDQETKSSDKMTVVYTNEKLLTDKYYYNTPFCKSNNEDIIIECKLRPNKVLIKNVCHDNLDDTLPVDLRRLLRSGELYDTVLEVGNQQFKAHYIILCARLQLFVRTVIHKPPSETEKCVMKINNLPASVVKEMLKYAYTGQAYLDKDTVLGYQHVIRSYSENLYRSCCWEDNPIAETFFSYETDSISWPIPSNFTKSDVARGGINLLKTYPSSIELSLDILEREADKRGLALTIKFCGKIMPKPAVVSCKYYLLAKADGEPFEFGTKEVLLHSDMTQAQVKLCSLVEVKRGMSHLCADDGTLEIDFRFCYGSTKSSIKDLYEGQFDISKCTSCMLLSKEMEHLYRFVYFHDIRVKNDQFGVNAHKAVLIARWADAWKFKVRENDCITIEGFGFRSLYEFIRQLYTGSTTKWTYSY